MAVRKYCYGSPGPLSDQQKRLVIDYMLERAAYGTSYEHLKYIMSLCSPAEKELLKSTCTIVMETPREKNTWAYGVCCDELKTCGNLKKIATPFYTQIWFFAVCGGVGLLLIIGIAVVVYLYGFRKKKVWGSSGRKTKSSESTSKKSRK
ncbi:unnamed protein product [Caenorhabditis nigoni]